MRSAICFLILLSAAASAQTTVPMPVQQGNNLCQALIDTCNATTSPETCIQQAYAGGWSVCQVIQQQFKSDGGQNAVTPGAGNPLSFVNTITGQIH
jgi:hypothetical protein